MGIFLEYLKISLWMAPVILVGLWLLPKLSKRYTAKLAYFVWLIIALRLIVPWNLTLPAETAPIQLDIPQETMVQWVPVDLSRDAANVAAEAEKAPVTLTEMRNAAEEKTNLIMPMQIVFALWLAGASISLLRTAASTYQLKKLLKRWEKAPSEGTAKFYAETAGESRPPLFICPALETPMAVGLFDTKIYLPHEEYGEQELEMIFCHELIHWRRKDIWYKFLLVMARSIHWFNPLVWFMAKRANRDLEISCDGEAVQEKDMAYRKAYSLMILQEAERGIQKQAALTTCFTDGKKALQERLVEILNGEKRKRGMALIAMTLILALSCGCLVGYGGADPIEEQEIFAEQKATNAATKDEITASETVANPDSLSDYPAEGTANSIEEKESSPEQQMTNVMIEENTIAETVSNGYIPTGYPTDSMTVSAPFVMGEDSFKKHTGMDFPTEGNVPVHATADGIILEAGFDSSKGNYVKINHLNGYTTLYAHLSELDVKAGDKVAKGDVLGLTGKTGMAVGTHCHYEIQLNDVYQDPANYL